VASGTGSGVSISLAYMYLWKFEIFFLQMGVSTNDYHTEKLFIHVKIVVLKNKYTCTCTWCTCTCTRTCSSFHGGIIAKSFFFKLIDNSIAWHGRNIYYDVNYDHKLYQRHLSLIYLCYNGAFIIVQWYIWFKKHADIGLAGNTPWDFQLHYLTSLFN
jgi:hypothetical protein